MSAALPSNVPILKSGDIVPVPPIDFTVSGVGQRIAAHYRKDPAAFASGGLLARIVEIHGHKLKSLFPDAGQESIVTGIMQRAKAALGIGTAKVAATPATASTVRPVAIPAPGAPAVDPLAGLSVQDRQEIAAWERRYATLKTEAERDAYVDRLAAQLKAPSKPADAAKPDLSLDEQYAAITDHVERVAFLSKHSREVLRRR